MEKILKDYYAAILIIIQKNVMINIHSVDMIAEINTEPKLIQLHLIVGFVVISMLLPIFTLEPGG